MEIITAIIGGSCGAAVVTGIFAIIQYTIKRKDTQSDRADVNTKALRYIMLYIIQERAKEYIRDKTLTLDERRSLHHWHDLYHNGLGGNGDADALMQQVDKLPIKME